MRKAILTLLIVAAAVMLLAVLIPAAEIQAAPDWLYYDNGTAADPSSSFKFQGVRFSLPDDVLKTQLLTISFYYSGPASCPVTVHVTSFDHSTELITPIDYSAGNIWNYVDLSSYNILVPHNFYVILEGHNCGSPVLDDAESSGRSFKGKFLQSLNTLLSRNLLIRSEIGPPVSIPVTNEWNVNITEKVKIKIKGQKPETDMSNYVEKWTLFNDGSFQKDDKLYGTWKQKGLKFAVSLDPEDIGDVIKDIFPEDVTAVVVTKISFTGTEKKDGTIKGKYKVYAGVHFHDENGNDKVGTITIEQNFTGTPK